MQEAAGVDIAWQRWAGATQRGAESLVRVLVQQGEVAADRAEQAVDELLDRSQEPRRVVTSLVVGEAERAVARLGLARQRDVERLQARIDELERRPAPAGDGPAPAGAGAAAPQRRVAAKRPRVSAAAKRAAARGPSAADGAGT